MEKKGNSNSKKKFKKGNLEKKNLFHLNFYFVL